MNSVDIVITHAAELVTCKAPGGRARGGDLSRLEVIQDGAVAIRDGVIVDVGVTGDVLGRNRADRTITAEGRLVSPGFVDPHTHLVYAGSRHDEWEGKVTEQPNPGIDAGIRGTLTMTRAATPDQLRAQALRDLDAMLRHGTTTVEAKSGYGLDRETELRLLAVANGLNQPGQRVEVVTTYLGAHVLAPEYLDDREGYLRLILETLPDARRYAEYCDLACDPICFTADECSRLAEAARALGFRLRLHADQTGDAGGTALAAALGASSADHLDTASPEALAALAASDTVGVIFPTVTHHMLETVPGRQRPPIHTDRPTWARHLIDSGATLALSTDYNPGSSPGLSMQNVMQTAARLYRLSYAEIWHMCTINAAAALDREDYIGSIEPGKRANLVIWQVPAHGMVIHRFGENLVDSVLVDGEVAVAGRAAQNSEPSPTSAPASMG